MQTSNRLVFLSYHLWIFRDAGSIKNGEYDAKRKRITEVASFFDFWENGKKKKDKKGRTFCSSCAEVPAFQRFYGAPRLPAAAHQNAPEVARVDYSSSLQRMTLR